MLNTNRRRGLLAAAGTLTLGTTLAGVPAAYANTTLPTSVRPTYQTNGRVSAILTIGGTTYLGGSFTSLRPAGAAAGTNEHPRAHLAALDASTGALKSWNPGADGAVRALVGSPGGGTVYAGGEFSKVGGQTRHHVAALNPSTGAVTGFNPSANLSVLSLAATSSRIYLGGTFSTVAGQTRQRLAAVSTTGALDGTWKPSANATVRAVRLSPSASSVYVGGDFTAISGNTTQKRFAKLSPTNGAASSWSSHPTFPVYGIAATTGQVFLGGNGAGGHAAAYTTSGGQQWIVQTDGGVQAIATRNGVVYVGGHFDNVCKGDSTGATSGFNCPTVKATRHKLLAVNASTAALDPWAPNPNSTLGVWSLEAPGSLKVGGDFTQIGANPRSNQQGYAQFG